MSTPSPKTANRVFSSCVSMMWSEVSKRSMSLAPRRSAQSRISGVIGRPLASLRVPTLLEATTSPGPISGLSEPARPDERTTSRPASSRQQAAPKSKHLMPIPVRKTHTVHWPIWASQTSTPFDQCSLLIRMLLHDLSIRQGANSASTANVTRTFMAICSDAELKPSTTRAQVHALQRSRRLGYAPGAPRGDVAVGFVPAHGALQRCFHRAWSKTQFTLGSRAINKHFVPRNFHALDGYLRFSKCEP